MKRIALVAVVVAVGVFTATASASTGAVSDAHRSASSKTFWTAEYTAGEYYGAVKCSGKTVINKKYPFGKETEKCETAEGTLKHMKAGTGQVAFENTGGGFVSEWESDTGNAKRTTNYTYKVNKKLTKFTIIAIYES